MYYNWVFSEAIKHEINASGEIFHSDSAIRRRRRRRWRSRLSSGADFRCLCDNFFVCIHSPGTPVFQIREWGEKNKTKKRTTNELKIPRHVVSWEITAVSPPHALRITRSVGEFFLCILFWSSVFILVTFYSLPTEFRRTRNAQHAYTVISPRVTRPISPVLIGDFWGRLFLFFIFACEQFNSDFIWNWIRDVVDVPTDWAEGLLVVGWTGRFLGAKLSDREIVRVYATNPSLFL